MFLEQSTRTVGFTRKIPLYAEFVKMVLENSLKWRGNSMTYLASIGITNAVLACISCSENGHRKARWLQNDNDFCIKNIVQHYIDYISLQKQKTAYAAIILSGEPAAAEGYKIQKRFPDRRQSAENAVSGDDGYYEKVDGSAAGLEPHPCAVVHLFRWAYAGLTPAAEECQGYMNGFAALDIPPCRRYVVVKATAGFAVCRLILNLLLFYSCLDFTQNLGETRWQHDLLGTALYAPWAGKRPPPLRAAPGRQ